MVRWGIAGLKEVEDTLKRFASDEARRRVNLAGARVLVSDAVQAFSQPAFRPAPWPPLAASTLGRAGASDQRAKEARAKSREWSEKAMKIAEAGAALTGRKLEKTLAQAARADKKAKEWKAKARAAKAKAIADRQPLYDTGHLKQSISLKVGAGKAGVASDVQSPKGFPYAVVHQYGSRTVPARPFIPVLGAPGSERLSDREKARVVDAMAGELRKIATGR